METYSLDVWFRRRTLAKLGSTLEYSASLIGIGQVIQAPTLGAAKVSFTGLAELFPPRPSFRQIEGIDPTVGALLDYHEALLDDVENAAPVDVGRLLDVYHLVSESAAGTVFVWPSFYGRDP